MDLSRQVQFRGAGMEAMAPPQPEPETPGKAMLAAAWASLAAARAETVEIHLRSGIVISGVMAIRVDGALGEASTLRNQWTHLFAIADVAMVHVVPRGGARG